MSLIEAILNVGWDPNEPSDSCRERTAQFAASVSEKPHLSDVDKVGIVRTLVVMELKVLTANERAPRGKERDSQGQQFVRASVWHALRSLGHGRHHPDGKWDLPPADEEVWADRLNQWDTGRAKEVGALWDDANERDALDEPRDHPDRFEPILTLEELIAEFGYCDPDGDVRAMRDAVTGAYGGRWVGPLTLKEMPDLFDFVRRTDGGKERRLMYAKDGALHLGKDQVERGLDGLLGGEIKPSALSIDAPSDVTGAAQDPESPDLGPAELAVLYQQVRRAREVLDQIRLRANPGTGTAIVLEPANHSFLADGGTFAELARREGRDESTLRQAHARVVDEVRDGLTG